MSLLAKSVETRIVSSLIVILLLLDAARNMTSSFSTPSFSPIVIQGEYGPNNTYKKRINAMVEYVFLYPASNVSSDKTKSFTRMFTLLIK